MIEKTIADQRVVIRSRHGNKVFWFVRKIKKALPLLKWNNGVIRPVNNKNRRLYVG